MTVVKERVRIEWEGDRFIADHQTTAEKCRSIIQQIVDSAPLELAGMRIEDVDRMVGTDSLERVVRDLLMENIEVPAGLNPEKYKEMLDIPDAVAQWMQDTHNAGASFIRAKQKRSNSNSNANFPFRLPSEFLKLSKGKVTILPGAKDAIIEKNAKFIESEAQERAINLAAEIADKLNEYHAIMGGNPSQYSKKIQFTPDQTAGIRYSKDQGYYSVPVAILNNLK